MTAFKNFHKAKLRLFKVMCSQYKWLSCLLLQSFLWKKKKSTHWHACILTGACMCIPGRFSGTRWKNQPITAPVTYSSQWCTTFQTSLHLMPFPAHFSCDTEDCPLLWTREHCSGLFTSQGSSGCWHEPKLSNMGYIQKCAPQKGYGWI